MGVEALQKRLLRKGEAVYDGCTAPAERAACPEGHRVCYGSNTSLHHTHAHLAMSACSTLNDDNVLHPTNLKQPDHPSQIPIAFVYTHVLHHFVYTHVYVISEIDYKTKWIYAD